MLYILFNMFLNQQEILKTKVSYKNDAKDRKVILFLNDCSCPKKFCKEKAAIAVQGCLKRVTLEDCATDICIEYVFSCRQF